MNKSKYTKGDYIKSLDELMVQDFIYHRGKIVNFGWFQNWQMLMAKRMIDGGYLNLAVKKESVE